MIYNFLSEEFQVLSNVSNFLFSLQFQQLEHRLQARQADVPGEPESQLRPPAGRLDLDFYMYDNCTKKDDAFIFLRFLTQDVTDFCQPGRRR